MSRRKRPRRITSGETIANCPEPGFEGVLFADDIDWSDVPAAEIGEETAAALVRRLPASLVQAAIDASGSATNVEAWRLSAELLKDTPRMTFHAGVNWDDLFSSGAAPASDVEIARLHGCSVKAVHQARQSRKIPPFRPARAMVLIEINGVRKSIKAWSRDSGINRSTITQRVKAGVTGPALIAAERLCVRYSPEERRRRNMERTRERRAMAKRAK